MSGNKYRLVREGAVACIMNGKHTLAVVSHGDLDKLTMELSYCRDKAAVDRVLEKYCEY